MHDLVNLDRNKFFRSVHKSHETRSHDLQIKKTFYRNNVLANIFEGKEIDCWKHSDEKIVTASSLSKFMSSLRNFNLNPYLSSNG